MEQWTNVLIEFEYGEAKNKAVLCVDLLESILAESQYSVKVVVNMMVLVIILVIIVTENPHHLSW